MKTFEEFRAESEARYQIQEGSVIPLQQERMRKIIADNPDIKRIVEVGFNGGLSCATLLSARPDITVVSFDIGRWDYTKKGEELMHEMYPDRFRLIYGDSTKSLPKYISENPGERHAFDMAFVDGGHVHPVPLTDLQNISKDFVKPGGLVLMDDYGCVHGVCGVDHAWQTVVAEGTITEEGTETDADRGWVWGRTSQN